MFANKAFALLWFLCCGLRSGANGDSRVIFVILQEATQENLPQLIGNVLKSINDQFRGQINIDDNYVILNRVDFNETTNSICEMLSKGATLIIDTTYTPELTFSDIIEQSAIPYIHIDITYSQFTDALEKFLQARLANDAAFIFQNDEELTATMYQVVGKSQLRLIFLNIENSNWSQRIKVMRPSPTHIVAFANSNNMARIIQEANRQRLIEYPDQWHLVYLDHMAKASELSQHIGINYLKFNAELCCGNKFESTPCVCPDNFDIRNKVISETLDHLVTTISNENYPINFWNCNENVSTDTRSIVQDSIASSIQSSTSLTIDGNAVNLALNISVFKEGDEMIGFWKSDRFLVAENVEIKMTRKFLRIGTTEAIPWAYLKRDPKTREKILDGNGRPIWEGYCIDLMQKLSEGMDFDYEIVEPKSGTFGQVLSDGNWDGLIGDLVSGETELAVAPLKMTADREEVIDFIAPYFDQTGILIVIRQAVRETSLFKFMTVLRLEVWLSIIGALTGTAIMLWLLDKYSPYSAHNNKAAYTYPCREFTLKESFWFALTSFTPQGGGEAPKALSGRILVAAYWLFVVLMLATFTANLAAFLTVERMQSPVQSLEQLARQSRINYTVVEGSDTHQYFINMKFAEDTLYRLWKEITLNSTSDQHQYRVWEYPIKEQYGHILLAINRSMPVKDAAEGFRNVDEHENADYAFIHDAAEIRYEISRNCNLTEVGEMFAEQPYALAVQQGSLLQDELSRQVLMLQKARFFEDLISKYWNNSAKGDCPHTDENEGITLESLGGVFIATLFGLGLALVTLVGEVLYYRRKDLTSGSITKVQPVRRITENIRSIPPPYDGLVFRGKRVPENITIGSEFVPANDKRRNSISFFRPSDTSNRLEYTGGLN